MNKKEKKFLDFIESNKTITPNFQRIASKIDNTPKSSKKVSKKAPRLAFISCVTLILLVAIIIPTSISLSKNNVTTNQNSEVTFPETLSTGNENTTAPANSSYAGEVDRPSTNAPMGTSPTIFYKDVTYTLEMTNDYTLEDVQKATLLEEVNGYSIYELIDGTLIATLNEQIYLMKISEN